MHDNIINETIMMIYEKFNEGKITAENANKMISLFTEMKSKEEYRKDKVFGGKSKKNPYFNTRFNTDTNNNIIGDIKKSDDNKTKLSLICNNTGIIDEGIYQIGLKLSNKYGRELDGKYKIHRIYADKDDFKRKSSKEIATAVAHELGHAVINNQKLSKNIEDLISSVIGENGEKIKNPHTSRKELRADYFSVKRIGKDSAISSLIKEAKRLHREVNNDPKLSKLQIQKAHDQIDNDINLRIKFIKLIKPND